MNTSANRGNSAHPLLNSAPVIIVAVACLYALAAKVSFLFTIPPGNVSPVFPAAGIALAAALILGRNALTGIWVGSFAANAISFFDGSVSPHQSGLPVLLVAALIGLGATSGAAAGASLVWRFCQPQHPLYSGRNVLILMVVGALGCCMVSATIGVLSLSLGGYIPGGHIGYSWVTWWAGDATGSIVTAPLILAWHQPHPFRRHPWRILEAAALGGLTLLLCFFVFFRSVPFAYGLMPLLLWAAFRFGMRGASTAAATIALLATIGASRGGSPFVQGTTGTMNETLLTLHSFLDVTIVCALFLAGVLADRQRMEASLRQSESALRSVFQSAPVGISFMKDGVFQRVNNFWCECLGYSEANVLGKTARMLYDSDEESDHVRRELDADLRKDGLAIIATRQRRSDGTFRDVFLRAAAIDAEDLAAGVVVIVDDISERKRVEEELRATQATLEERVFLRTTELAVAKERAESADRLKSAFLATMSHELRTPLNSIIGFTGIILRGLAGPLNAEQTKQLVMVQNSSRHLLSLINDVLDLSKIEAGQLEIHPEYFDLCASLEKVAGLIKPLAEKKGLALRVVLSDNLAPVDSDRMRVEQVMLNLLNNAVKFTEHGEVALEGLLIQAYTFPKQTTPQPVVRLSVTDTGIGIKPEDMDKIFKPFRQIDSGLTRRHEGTGLGLAICRRLADHLGGEVSAHSTWGEGSVFTFVIPLKYQEGEQHDPNPNS